VGEHVELQGDQGNVKHIDRVYRLISTIENLEYLRLPLIIALKPRKRP
jgi:hypothetical protein